VPPKGRCANSSGPGEPCKLRRANHSKMGPPKRRRAASKPKENYVPQMDPLLAADLLFGCCKAIGNSE
jgi:hypothetical protein